MMNMFAYPSMDGQHDGITIFFFLWRCKYSVPSFLIIPAASISLNRKEIGGNNIRPHPVCFYFPESWENCHERANYHYSAYRKADSSFANRKMCAETFFNHTPKKNDNQPYKKKIKTIVRWFQIHIFVTESKITEEVCLPTRKKYWKMHYGYSPK